MKKMLLCILALSVFIGASLVNSAFASTPEMYVTEQNFETMSSGSEMNPEWFPLVVAGAKVVAGSVAGGFGAAAGAWAFDKITGIWSVPDYSYDNGVEIVFNK
ncbi:hypothetical protein [Caldalkalibacillus mannanilyticus]|uniref:hypothetical protein n=1 Tax=Caldalkalibacillus mannanilyticus TaxID=1418 RepID=UPI000469D945|nr:hypothetical protein [Caldalkalibacillus mannanilyticus]